ncbi:UDP-N-acetylglucosamine pyrophosphorylase [Cryptococcus deuterogattii R265]|uniref:UDP-N-acetylglucosamine pyrophosphorylase n=1 Tax=Cryptococcus deuterogattii (strain R265) TaxID=294750 RepID=UPI001935D6B4|nr:UDP-N-acetylglucosamine pyrophosphorylase [Cryptococcus deuterogattii R265]
MTVEPAPDPALLAQLRALYASAGQSHVFSFYESLSPAEQAALLNQLASIDVHRVNRIYSTAIAADPALTPSKENTNIFGGDQPNHKGEGANGNLVGTETLKGSLRIKEEAMPLPEEACATVLNNPSEEAQWRDAGLKVIANNQVAVLLMAGGQGSRLGSALPKGLYDIKLPSGQTLFEYQAKRIRKLERLAEEKAGKEKGSVSIRWCTPALSNDGKLLLSTPSSVSVAPDGNGGLYAALRRPLSPSSSRTVLSDLREHNVQYIHAYCVDNCLVRVADPVFIGCCISRNASAGAKVVRKTVPTESVGVLAAKGNAFAVVEYSELSKEKAEQRTADGQLAFRAANIANHFYTTAFLESVEEMEQHMAFHIARKKIPTVDLATGELVKPSEPNGMKLELFVFDVFPFTKSLCVLEVDRAEEFSPLKNAPGSKADCPETSRRDLLAQQKRWLIASGAEIADDVEIEVSPEVSYAGEGLDWIKGKTFTKSGVLSSQNDLKALAA